ncbi:HU family DNA-binding protein [Haloglycomyces albus]|uniref:HU family DNA-binding protein n=1 Tax=Haloglycomyces albus TaxID=526067 RepID=UPI0004A291F4|nr:HU family DNA-binding protein [Haloglycomyces albus]
MNKAEFVERIASRTGERQQVKEIVDVAIDEIQRAVVKGEKVSFAGFGVFEKRKRAARMARNPRTGEAVRVKKTVVPAFRPGTGFKELVTGKRKLPKLAKRTAKKAAKKTTRAAAGTTSRKKVATSRVAKKAAKKTARKSTARKAAAKKATRRTTRRK